jgi:hypothetical protein
MTYNEYIRLVKYEGCLAWAYNKATDTLHLRAAVIDLGPPRMCCCGIRVQSPDDWVVVYTDVPQNAKVCSSLCSALTPNTPNTITFKINIKAIYKL